jgi:hypothetical protein
MMMLDAVVVGMQLVARRPMRMGSEGVPLSRALAAMEMCMTAV